MAELFIYVKTTKLDKTVSFSLFLLPLAAEPFGKTFLNITLSASN